MNVIKRLAPNYWLGYYAVYGIALIILTARYGHLIINGSDSEQIFVSAAIFGAATGMALTSAITAEGVGYLVLLIPRRIKQIRDEVREEVRAEVREEMRAEMRAARAERRKEESVKTGPEAGANSEVERERVRTLFALYDSGEITLDALRVILASGSLNGENGTD